MINAHDYEQALAVVNVLLETIGERKEHPLADLLHYLVEQIEVYEEATYPTPEVAPEDIQRFLME